MQRFSVNRLSTRRWSFAQTLQHCVAASIPAIGLWRDDLEDLGEDQALDLIQAAELQVSNLFWIGDFFGNRLFNYREAMDDAVRAIHFAKRVNCKSVVISEK